MFVFSMLDLHKNIRSVRNMTQKVRPMQMTKDHIRPRGRAGRPKF